MHLNSPKNLMNSALSGNSDELREYILWGHDLAKLEPHTFFSLTFAQMKPAFVTKIYSRPNVNANILYRTGKTTGKMIKMDYLVV